jgi:hypothetical protein
MIRTRGQQTRRGFVRQGVPAVSWCVTLALALLLITVHAQHLSEDRTAAAVHHAPHVLSAAGYHAGIGLDTADSSMHCSLPSMLLPQVELRGLIAPLAQPIAAVLLPGFALQHSFRTGWDPPRPPGPTRQAILHRFRL